MSAQCENLRGLINQAVREARLNMQPAHALDPESTRYSKGISQLLECSHTECPVKLQATVTAPERTTRTGISILIGFFDLANKAQLTIIVQGGRCPVTGEEIASIYHILPYKAPQFPAQR